MKKDYAVGDVCWIHLGGEGRDGNPLVQGKVVHSFSLPGWSDERFVVQVQTHVDPVLAIRGASTISEDSDGPVGAFRFSDKLKAAIAEARL